MHLQEYLEDAEAIIHGIGLQSADIRTPNRGRTISAEDDWDFQGTKPPTKA